MAEWRSAGRLLGLGLGTLVDTVAAMHDTIAQRVEAKLPPGIASFAAAHRAGAGAVYTTVGFGHRTIPAALGYLAPSEAAPLSSSRLGRAAVPIVNGLWGDAIEARGEALAITMGLAHTSPAPTGQLVIFVHGLFEDERVWLMDEALGTRFEANRDVSPLFVRYNSGLRVSNNGRRLSDLIARTVDAWPIPVTSIALVGHSMGGLVSRSAAQFAHETRAEWLSLLTHVISLSTPHLGSPVEKAVHIGDWVLRQVPHTRPLGELVANRSGGIKDLRFGAVVEADWRDEDAADFLRDRCTEVPLLDGVTYCWVAALLGRDSGGLVSWVLGDGIVRQPSAVGQGRARRIDPHRGIVVTGTNHFNVVSNEQVHAQILDWLGLATR